SFAGPTEAVGDIVNLELPGPAGILTLRAYTPVAAAPGERLAGLIYFHGGGLVAGNLETHDPVCRSLANATGCLVFSADYPLAPEHRFPAAVEDGCAASAWVAANATELSIDPDRLGLCGDSAGATLAAVICQRLSQEGHVRIACQFLLCPITDFAAETESRR